MTNRAHGGVRSAGAMHPRRRLRPRGRWAARAGVLTGSGVLAAGLALGITATSAAAADSGTQGNAYSQLFQVTPYEGSLAVGAVFGEAIAGHTNGFARAQSQGVDLGAVGDSIRGYNCGAPQDPHVAALVPSPFQTETGADGASAGQTQQPSSSNYGATEFVQATDAPYGEADTTYGGPFADPTGAVVLAGLHSKSWSGVVNGATVAGASSDIASLSLGDGAVVLNGLHWQSTYPVAGTGQPTGLFSIGQVKIAGVALPALPDLSTLVTVINQALGQLGLQLVLPQVFESQGVEFVTPLQVDVVPNTTRDQILDPLIVQFQSQAYGPLANALENGFAAAPAPYNSLAPLESGSNGQQIAQNLCKSDSGFTVADVTIASLDGGGHFTMSLGGVQSSASPVVSNPYDLATFDLGTLSLPGSSTFIPGTAGAQGLLGPSTQAPGTAATGASPSVQPLAVRTTGLSPTEKAGSLLIAVLAGLGLVAFLIEGDRRLMRRAQKSSSQTPKE